MSGKRRDGYKQKVEKKRKKLFCFWVHIVVVFTRHVVYVEEQRWLSTNNIHLAHPICTPTH
jgi:hypothetical protein